MPVEISVILPAYREEHNLRQLLPELKKILATLTHSWEVIVVDAHSPVDFTKQCCAEHGIECVSRQDGDSYGDAVRTGIKYSSGRFVIFMDADGSHSPKYIPVLFRWRNDFDIVVGSRYVDGGRTENPWYLILMSKLVNRTFMFVLGLPCNDVSNSFKLYRADMLKSVNLRCKNFDIIEEIMVLLISKKTNLRIKEIPMVFAKRVHGITKRNLWVFALTYIFTLLRLKIYKTLSRTCVI